MAAAAGAGDTGGGRSATGMDTTGVGRAVASRDAYVFMGPEEASVATMLLSELRSHGIAVPQDVANGVDMAVRRHTLGSQSASRAAQPGKRKASDAAGGWVARKR